MHDITGLNWPARTWYLCFSAFKEQLKICTLELGANCAQVGAGRGLHCPDILVTGRRREGNKDWAGGRGRGGGKEEEEGAKLK